MVRSGSSAVRVGVEDAVSDEFTEESLDLHRPPKSVRNGLYLLDDDAEVSPREQRHHNDDDDAAILGRVLASDEVFHRKCELVAESAILQRWSTAEREACAYTPYRGAHRDLIVELLLAGAKAWDDYPGRFAAPVMRFRVQNLKRRSIWLDDETERDDEPRRWRDRKRRLEDGALRVARHGAGRCIGCDERLAGDRYERGPRGRRVRRFHCSARCPEARTAGIQASQLESMRDAFDAATGQRRARRAARRKAR
jgi:hypothetical protein